jgi:hypothetical protein
MVMASTPTVQPDDLKFKIRLAGPPRKRAVALGDGPEGKQRVAEASRSSERFVVRGRLFEIDGDTGADSRPLKAMVVRAYDKDMRNEATLGETATDQHGRYEIVYTRDQFNRAEKRTADLIVRAFKREVRNLSSLPKPSSTRNPLK